MLRPEVAVDGWLVASGLALGAAVLVAATVVGLRHQGRTRVEAPARLRTALLPWGGGVLAVILALRGSLLLAVVVAAVSLVAALRTRRR